MFLNGKSLNPRASLLLDETRTKPFKDSRSLEPSLQTLRAFGRLVEPMISRPFNADIKVWRHVKHVNDVYIFGKSNLLSHVVELLLADTFIL